MLNSTQIKLVTAGGDYNADGSFTTGEKVITPGNAPRSTLSQKIAQSQNYEMFDWRQSNQSLNQENELKYHLHLITSMCSFIQKYTFSKALGVCFDLSLTLFIKHVRVVNSCIILKINLIKKLGQN